MPTHEPNVEGPTPASAGLDANAYSPTLDRSPEARRYVILKMLFEKGSLSVSDLRGDRNFKRRFKQPSEDAIKGDFADLQQVLGLHQPEKDKLHAQVVGTSSFATLSYGSGTSDKSPKEGDNKPESSLDQKTRIGRYIVKHYLKASQEVVYLSTGTTVYEVAVALVDKVDIGEKENIAVIVSDNLAIIYLFNRRVPCSSKLDRVRFVGLGGHHDYNHGDVTQGETTFQQLAQWEFSTAVVSATKINPRTGAILSFRQPETKKRFLTDVDVDQLIIPVLPNKIEVAGGQRIHDPPGTDPKSRAYHIVTTKLPEPICKNLKNFNYEVNETDDDV